MPDPKDEAVSLMLKTLVQTLVHKLGDVSIHSDWHNDGASFTIRAHRSDLSRVVGRQGNTLEALRAIVKAYAMRNRRRYSVFVEQ